VSRDCDDWGPRSYDGLHENDVTVEGRRKGATADAILVEIDGEDHWLPSSQIVVVKSGGRFSDLVHVTMPAWLAEDRGIA
jgi:hypothetical protein